MTENDNRQYYFARAKAEREAAAKASDPGVIRIHLAMAKAYDCRIGINDNGSRKASGSHS